MTISKKRREQLDTANANARDNVSDTPAHMTEARANGFDDPRASGAPADFLTDRTYFHCVGCALANDGFDDRLTTEEKEYVRGYPKGSLK